MEKVKNIYERMLAITAELQTVAKNLTVQQTKTSSYKAVGERDVLDAVKPLEAKHGIYSYPVARTILESHMLESESTYNGQTTKKTTFFTRLETVYRFVNVENPEEYIEITSFAEGIDTQDKGSGKAMTYCDKYALMKAYKISTGDDPDQEASKDENYTKKGQGKKQQTPPPAEPEQPPVIMIDEVKIKVLKQKMAQKGVTEKKMLARYKVAAFEEMTVEHFMAAMKALEATPDAEPQQVDLGL